MSGEPRILQVPVEPEPPEAAEWLIDELSKPVYQAAKPTLFDLVAQAIGDWISSLRFGQAEGPPALALGIVLGLLVAAIVVALLVFGLPRLNRRSTVPGVLFGEEDRRDAAQLRRDAEAAARRGEFSLAIAEMFRAIARGLAERTIVAMSPGTTAREFALRAGPAFPAHAEHLARAAVVFDDVRYLGRDGDLQRYEDIAALEAALRAARPALEAVP